MWFLYLVLKKRDDKAIDVFYNKRLRKIPRIKWQDDFSFFLLNIFAIAPRLIKGAHNNTLTTSNQRL